jgi:hypothetical protein
MKAMTKLGTAAATAALLLTALASPAPAAVPMGAPPMHTPVHVQSDINSVTVLGVEAFDVSYRCPLPPFHGWSTSDYECRLFTPGVRVLATDMGGQYPGGISDYVIGQSNLSVKEWAWNGSTPYYIGCENGPGRFFINYAETTLRVDAFRC